MFRRLGSRIKHVSTKLLLLLMGCLACGSALLGYVNIRLHRHDLEAVSLEQAMEISDFVTDNMHRSMMANDRDALSDVIHRIGSHKEVERIRVVDHDGRVKFSSDAQESGTLLRRDSSECVDCHGAGHTPITAKRFRIYVTKSSDRHRVLGVIAPILNEPECSNAACHAHPASARILGILDTGLSLHREDASLAQTSFVLTLLLLAGTGCVAVIVWLAIRTVLHQPLCRLQEGTEHLARGELGYQTPIETADELGDLAGAFNSMSRQLCDAQREITKWMHTLERRVEQKTGELRRTQQQMLHVERMIAIGRMSAVVAHEINNPLAGILTYAKLLRRWITGGIQSEEQKQEAIESLDLIAAESKRCGDLLRNLLSFSRTAPMNLSLEDLNSLVTRAIRLCEHRAEMASVALQVELEVDLRFVQCDAAQIEQVALVLIVNALDAMPHGGNLWISTRRLAAEGQVELQVRDDGIGIQAEVLPRIFEPFTTTKEVGKGVGLGLAVSKGIVERHGGQIEVDSQLGVGTTFRIILPVRAHVSEIARATASIAD